MAREMPIVPLTRQKMLQNSYRNNLSYHTSCIVNSNKTWICQETVISYAALRCKVGGNHKSDGQID